MFSIAFHLTIDEQNRLVVAMVLQSNMPADTHFPDLLEGVPAANLERKSRKKKSKRKVEPRDGMIARVGAPPDKNEPGDIRIQSLKKAEKKQDFLDAVGVMPEKSHQHSHSPNAVDADIGSSGSSKRSYVSKREEMTLSIPDLDNEGTARTESITSDQSATENIGADDASCSELDDDEDAAVLLRRANDRVARQELKERVTELETELAKKQLELQTMHGQLRMATATKCDLVVAHKELEKSHEDAVAAKNQNLIQMKRANQLLLELQAQTDFELLNELIRVTEMYHGLQRKHQEELDDWERMHRNEMLEKDYEIAHLTEELRRMGLRPPKD